MTVSLQIECTLLVVSLVSSCVHMLAQHRLADSWALISEALHHTYREQGMAVQVQAQPGMHQVLVQAPDVRLRPPYLPLHPPAPYAQQRPPASVHLGGVAGQQLMLVVPHSPQVIESDTVASSSKDNSKLQKSGGLWEGL